MATRTHRPNADAYIESFFGAPLTFGNPTDTPGSRYTNVDESVIDPNDYIAPVFASVAGRISFNVNVTVGQYSDTAISSVAIKFWCSRGAGFANQSAASLIRIGGSNYEYDFTAGGISAVFPSTQNATETLTTNPATGLPWTQADVENFRAGGTNSIGGMVYTDDTGQQAGLCMVEMTVTYTDVKRRKKANLPRLYKPPARHPVGVSI